MPKKIWFFFQTALPYLILIYLIWHGAPAAWRHFKIEGQTNAAFTLQRLDGAELTSAALRKPILIAFWATWCGPCTLELSRVQRLIDNGTIPADSVLAVTDENDLALVQSTVKERKYTFTVATDAKRRLFDEYQVEATPTLIVVGEDDKIAWMTSGLSPTLEIRLGNYLKPRGNP